MQAHVVIATETSGRTLRGLRALLIALEAPRRHRLLHFLPAPALQTLRLSPIRDACHGNLSTTANIFATTNKKKIENARKNERTAKMAKLFHTALNAVPFCKSPRFSIATLKRHRNSLRFPSPKCIFSNTESLLFLSTAWRTESVIDRDPWQGRPTAGYSGSGAGARSRPKGHSDAQPVAIAGQPARHQLDAARPPRQPMGAIAASR